jgi:glucosamine-6-phosphate deaminase
MNIQILPDYTQVCRQVAARIAELVRQKPDAVLGLATGSTPLGVYEELIRLHREEGLSFAGVRAFNLDEYYPLAADAPQSYARFMAKNLFDHIGILPENCFIPSGESRSMEEVDADCIAYDAKIAECGGLDLQLLGIGRTGHIGFNEPGSAIDSRTRLITLDSITRTDAAGDFFGLQNVPVRAITMGIATIMESREIILVASGAKKAEIVVEALEGKITSKVPASFLRQHPNVVYWFDENAASQLTITSTENREISQRQQWIKTALSDGRLLEELGEEALSIVEDLKRRSSDDVLPTGKTILCLSPHPDDDVICCGATLLKMASRGNNLYVAYGVNGANAVRDKDVLAHLRAQHPRLIAYLEENLEPGKSLETAVNEVRTSIFERQDGSPDAPLLRELKRLVREGEASDGCRKMKAKPIFLDLPFYGDGVERLPVGEDDVARMLDMLNQVRPDIVMLTGEKNDPHGTHEMCEQAFNLAAEQYDGEFERWNYRGAWDDYQSWEGDYFSVFEKPLMEQKIDLILDHISQLDPLFPGTQPKEFWERARDRNRENARQLQKLGVLPASRSFAPIYVEVFKFEDRKES